jgi:prevent-host-death family protein
MYDESEPDMKSKVISATEFKAKCLALLDEVAEEGSAITITKRGCPVAVLGPSGRNPCKSPRGAWANKLSLHGDIANIDTSDLWDVVRK